jgi:hypothetical protein
MKFMSRQLFFGVALASAGFGLSSPAAEVRGKTADFAHQVLPILKESCYSCHGPEKSKAGLRLDIKARALKGGENGPAIIPGNSAKSPLAVRLASDDDDERMPQKAARLSADKIQLIRDWIDQGAVWPETAAGADPAKHWSFQRLTHPQPPSVRNQRWARTPVDNFVLAKLEERKLAPSPVADRRVLIRRACLDLLGLPPGPDEVESFVADKSPNAYGKMIDGLLASPQYGERWARYWLDVARFAESDGFEQDTDRPRAYWYRDFVIKALNEDMPFNQFVQWQLAGDEFAPDDPWALAATGFLGAEQFPTQLTESEFEQARYDELDNMAATTGTAMLGLTVGCARCHDHKFDPISNRDYYRILTTFATTIRSDVDLEFHHEEYAKNKARFDLTLAPLVAAREKFEKELLPARFDQWLQARGPEPSPKPVWVILDPVESKSKGGATFVKQEDGSLLAGGANPDFDTYRLVCRTRLRDITAIRIEALADPSLVKGGPGRAENGNFDLTDLRVSAAPFDGSGKAVRLKLRNPKSTFDQGPQLSVALAIDDDKKTGWAVDPQFGQNHAATFEFEKPAGFDGGVALTITLDFQGNNHHSIGRPRVSITTLPLPAALTGESAPQNLVEISAVLEEAGGAAKLSPAQRTDLTKAYRALDPEWRKLDDAVRERLKQAPKPDLKKVMVTSEGFKPIFHFADSRGFPHFYKTVYILKRGDARQKGEVATPGFLQILDRSPDGDGRWQRQPPPGARTSYRRRALANWMTDTQYGAGELLARVIVNRLWQHHFGRGIVATPNDFGLQGDRPTHPELLDWLANDLIQHGWQLKRLQKLIMTSATYLQSSDSGGDRAGIDKENRFLWRYPRHRLEAEAIRDSILSVSGQLDEKMYGPGSLDPEMRRRSVYFFIKRSELVPFLMLFDFPEPNTSAGARVSTTVAPQALALINNPQIRSAARAFAVRLKPFAAESPEAAVTEGYLISLGRKPDAEELRKSVVFLQKQPASDQVAGSSGAGEIALADFCQVLFGLNEFIYPR